MSEHPLDPLYIGRLRRELEADIPLYGREMVCRLAVIQIKAATDLLVRQMGGRAAFKILTDEAERAVAMEEEVRQQS